MIKRLVKLTFSEENTAQFLEVFAASQAHIRSFPGCRHLELWKSRQETGVFFTYSIWERAEDLEQYRQSDLFRSVWSQTRVLFSDKPQAWSLDPLELP